MSITESAGTATLLKEKDIMEAIAELRDKIDALPKPSKNEFDHDGNLTDKQEVETFKLISLSIGYCAAFISQITALKNGWGNDDIYLYIASSVFLSYFSVKSIILSFKAITGNANTNKRKQIGYFLLLVCFAVPFAISFGKVLALIFGPGAVVVAGV